MLGFGYACRTKEEEKGEIRKYRKKATNAERKKQILVSLKELVGN